MAYKGHKPWNKGIRMWSNRPHPKGMLGKKSTRKGITFTYQQKYGLERGLEIAQKISNTKKGKIPHLQSLETREKISEYQKGKRHSEQTKERMSLAHIGITSWNKGIPNSEEQKQKIREKRIYQIMPLKDTKPERILQEALKDLNIPFIKHKAIKIKEGRGGYHQADIFIEPNIVIEADGDYWHNLPNTKERDKNIDNILTSNGYKIYRFWEHEIKQKV